MRNVNKDQAYDLPKRTREQLLKDIGKIRVRDLAWQCGGVGDVIFEGGCGELVEAIDAYRCTDCTVYFHRECARKHFGQDPKRKDWKD